MNPITLVEAFAEPGFLIGLGLGVIASFAAWLHTRTDVWLGTLGLAAMTGLVLNDHLAQLPTPPLALTGIAGGVVLLSAVGGWQMARDVGAVPVSVCLALTAIGVWGTVPDTENALVLLGAASGGALGGLRTSGARGSVAVGAALVLGVAAFIALTEGLARSSATVGALATFGMFALYPLGSRRWRSAPAWLVVSAHLVLVLLGGRVAGRASGAEIALVLVLVSFAAVGGAVVLLARRGSADV